MRPIPETIEAAAELGRYDPDLDMLAYLQRAADEVQTVVPDCVGLSLCWTDDHVAFTLVASDEEIAALDAVQYLEDGPCVEAVRSGRGIEVTEDDLLNERAWQLFGQATAARSVRSTLTLPLVTAGQVTGSANLYAASDRAFEGHHRTLALILGGSASDVVRNADLSFSTRATAEDAPAVVRDDNVLDLAVGVVIGALGLDPESALERLTVAAARAGISRAQFARALTDLF